MQRRRAPRCSAGLITSMMSLAVSLPARLSERASGGRDMANNKPTSSLWQGNWSVPLLHMAAGVRPPLRPQDSLRPPEPPRKGPGGRPKALSKKRLDDFRRATEGTDSKLRHFG